jgi:hypothetical protein
MKRPAVVLCFSIVFGLAQVSRAEPRSRLQLDARIGSVRAPFFVEGVPEVASEYRAYALVAAADLALKDWRGGIRLPSATSSIEQPAGSYVADHTLGNRKSLQSVSSSEMGLTREARRCATPRESEWCWDYRWLATGLPRRW